MDHDLDEYAAMFEAAGVDTESLTVLLVAGGSPAEVLHLLGADPQSSDEPVSDDEAEDYSAYAVTEVPGGVVAIEHTGYADPSPRVLAALSGLGGAAAVARSNIQGHERFGCARDGVLEFDADEFTYVEEHEKEAVPPDLRNLFDSAWVDLDADEDGGEWSAVFVAFAMAAQHTGVTVTSDDLVRATQRGYHRVRSQTYFE